MMSLHNEEHQFNFSADAEIMKKLVFIAASACSVVAGAMPTPRKLVIPAGYYICNDFSMKPGIVRFQQMRMLVSADEKKSQKTIVIFVNGNKLQANWKDFDLVRSYTDTYWRAALDQWLERDIRCTLANG